MRGIFRGHERYGEGTAAEQATRYRWTEMFEEVVAAAVHNSRDISIPEVDLVVSLSGFSPETTLLTFELVRPRQLLVISSENAADKYDIIDERLRGRLRPSQIGLRYCDPVDPNEIYEIVKKAVRPRPPAPPVSAIIDITGGKKVMSAGAALAASQLDLRMCYIDSEFDPEMRQAVPGTERLRILPNPTALFGDQDMEAALGMFRAGGYSGARARFAELSESISEPSRARFLCDLADLYQAWCDLDTMNLSRHAAAVRSRIDDPRSALRPETGQRLADQLAFVESLVEKDGSALLLNFFLLGEHYLSIERFDFAALLFYRTIEQSFSERLARCYDGFDLEKPDYSLLGHDPAELHRRYLTAARSLFPSQQGRESLPWKVGLVDAMLLLYVVDDRMLPAAMINDLRGVNHVQRLIEARNRSVLAHGVASVTRKQCDELRGRAQCNLRAFWKLHHTGEDVDERVALLRFVTEA